MALSHPHPAPDAADWRRRLGLVALTALVCAFLLWSQPPEGTVTGVCRDVSTGQALAGADVSLSLKSESGADDPADAAKETPPGWTQGSEDDASRDLSAAPSAPRREWHTRTDGAGRFTLAHVRAGEYALNASTDEHASDDSHTAVVSEGQTTDVTLPLRRSPARLSFAATTLDWTTAEDAVLPLQGLLRTRTLALTLERLDGAGALARRPSLLARTVSGDSGDDAPPWRGEFTPVRHWTYAVTHGDREGAFYERIPLGPLPPGLYRATAEAPEGGSAVTATGWVRVTNLALVRKTYGADVLAYVADLTTGRAVPGAALTLYDEAGRATRTLGRATTGPDGLARLSAADAPAESKGILVARSGDSTVALSYALNTPGDGDESGEDGSDAAPLSTNVNVPGRSLRSFLYSDRPVYRPGQTVRLKAVSRWFDAGRGYALPADRSVRLDVRDPQDTLVKHEDLRTNALGSWDTALALSPEALTGEYTVTAVLDGRKERTTFDVAAYHKPEYQVGVTFSQPRYVHGDTLEVTATAAYYYGAPVIGARATLRAYKSGSEGDDKEGDDGGGDTGGEPLVTENVTLDGSGRAFLRLPTKSGGPTGDEEYTVEVDVDDASGRSVSGEGKVIVAQGAFSLTVRPDVRVCRKGDAVGVTATATDASGRPLAGQDVQIEAEYRAWTPDGQDRVTPVKSLHAATAANGQASATVWATRDGEMSLRATAQDGRGNRITADADVWVPGGGEDAGLALPPRASDLSLVLDRAKYVPGQTAHLLLNTARPGPTALVTVEGATLSRAFTVPLTRHSNAVDLPVTADDAPSVTIKVCAVRGKQFLSSDDTLTVDDDRRALSVTLSTDRPAYHPGDPAAITVHVRDARGRPVPAEVSLGVVDSAIYALKPERPETIGDAFQPAQTDAVETDYSCRTETLGDVDKGAAGVDVRRKFPDTALWRPALQTGLDGNVTVHLSWPDTLTAWRMTAYGHTADTRVGKGVGNVTVGKDLLVRLETPPFLVAGDTGRLIGLVHNDTPRTVRATVRLSAPGLSVSGDAARTVDVAPGIPARLTWTVSAPGAGAAAGQPPILAKLTAVAGGLSDGVEEPIPLLPHGVVQDVWHSGTLLHRVSQAVTPDPQAIPGATRLTVRLSPSISTTLLPATAYLAGYPYGSTDATAAALLADAAVAPEAGAGLRNAAARSVLRLARMQGEDGGWGWFSTGKADLWMTAWAAWGLAQAQSGGFAVPPKVATAARTETASLAKAERNGPSPREDAISLAALALASWGDAKDALPNLRWLEKRWRSPAALPAPADLARAALAEFALGGDERGEAQALAARLWGVARWTGTLASWAGGGHRDAAGAGREQPDADATAWALLAGETAAPSDPRLDGAARWLMTARSGDHWAGPDPTAVAVRALALYRARSQEASPNFQATVFLNGRPARTLTFTPASLARPEAAFDLPGTLLTPGVNTVTVQKVGPGRLYYSLALRQCLSRPAPTPPVSLPVRVWNAVFHPGGPPQPPAPSGCRIRRVYLRMTSRRNWLWEDTVPAPDTRLNVGEGVLVRLIVNAARPASRVVIEEPIPAGFRVSEATDADGEESGHWWDYTDVRDDKIVFFVSDLAPGRQEIDYHLQAATPGTYDVMPTGMSSVVDPSLSVLGGTARLQVDAGD